MTASTALWICKGHVVGRLATAGEEWQPSLTGTSLGSSVFQIRGVPFPFALYRSAQHSSLTPSWGIFQTQVLCPSLAYPLSAKMCYMPFFKYIFPSSLSLCLLVECSSHFWLVKSCASLKPSKMPLPARGLLILPENVISASGVMAF